MSELLRHPLIDEIIDQHRAWCEGDEAGFESYRNHAQRVFTFTRHLTKPHQDADEKIAITAAFHF